MRGFARLVALAVAFVLALANAALADRIVWSEGGTSNGLSTRRIYSINPDGTRRRQLTDSPSQYPVWSPNHRLIAFVKTTVRSNGLPGDSSVWVMRADGSGERRLSRWTNTIGFQDISWAPGSARIVFSVGGTLRIAYADGRPGKTVPLPEGMNPGSADWSPDGSMLVFTASSGIWSSTPDGEQLSQLTPDGASPEWSPLGDEIAFITARDNTYEDANTSQVYVMKADGDDETRISTDPMTMKDWIEWSPFGKRIAFWQGCDDDICDWRYDIVVANSDGSGQDMVTDSWLREEGPVKWSSNGRWLLWGRWRTSSARMRMMTSRPNGANIHRIWPDAEHRNRVCCDYWDW